MKEVIEQIGSYVVSEIPEEITDIEENCGSMYITTKEGKTYFVMVSECEDI